MTDKLENNIKRLVALYESEKQRADRLEQKLSQCQIENSQSNEKILELKRQNDNLRLGGALGAGGSASETRESIDRLVSEIDRCIRLLEY